MALDTMSKLVASYDYTLVEWFCIYLSSNINIFFQIVMSKATSDVWKSSTI